VPVPTTPTAAMPVLNPTPLATATTVEAVGAAHGTCHWSRRQWRCCRRYCCVPRGGGGGGSTAALTSASLSGGGTSAATHTHVRHFHVPRVAILPLARSRRHVAPTAAVAVATTGMRAIATVVTAVPGRGRRTRWCRPCH